MKDLLQSSQVVLIKAQPFYSQTAPFAPSRYYPEWPDAEISAEENPAYDAIRQLFRHLGLDSRHYDTSRWNPLGELVAPGNTVVLKPNFVFHRNLGAEVYGLTDTDSLVTHGSVIRAVLDYTAKALQGRGRIIVGDSPLQGADWAKLVEVVGLPPIQRYFAAAFPGVELMVRDYRLGKAVVKCGRVIERRIDEALIDDYLEVDMGRRSLLGPLLDHPCEFGVTQYPKVRMRRAHHGNVHKYLIPKDLLMPDVMINLPKLKSHMKAGITAALKNFVGINGHKDYLPHFRYGSPGEGGDEYPDGNWLWKLRWALAHRDWEKDDGVVKRCLQTLSRVCAGGLWLSGTPKDFLLSVGGGGWHGNDTLWRTVLDINRAFLYFDRAAARVGDELRSDLGYLAIIDGIVGGERESPLAPSPVACGTMIASLNPLAADAVATACMGFDVDKVTQVREGFKIERLPLAAFTPADISIRGNTQARSLQDIYDQGLYTPFAPSEGYSGTIEYQGSGARAAVCERV